jgi:hypothetical protein
MLYAFGDAATPLSSTARCLDDAVTDFVIDLCHDAEARARTAGRSKVKVDDFTFALRADRVKVGRVQELAEMERYIRNQRQSFNPKKQLKAAAKEAGTEEGEKKGRKKGGAAAAAAVAAEADVEMEDEGEEEPMGEGLEADVKMEDGHDGLDH